MGRVGGGADGCWSGIIFAGERRWFPMLECYGKMIDRNRDIGKARRNGKDTSLYQCQYILSSPAYAWHNDVHTDGTSNTVGMYLHWPSLTQAGEEKTGQQRKSHVACPSRVSRQGHDTVVKAAHADGTMCAKKAARQHSKHR